MNEKHEFTVRIQWLDDPDADLSYLGEFSDRESAGAIHYSDSPRLYRYFIPAITEEEHYRDLRATVNAANPVPNQVYGIRTARKLAKKYVLEDMNRLASYGESWHMQGCTATIRYNGRVIGMASLWGIESDSDRAYFRETESDLLQEAYTDAQSFIGTLASVTLPALDSIEHDKYSELA